MPGLLIGALWAGLAVAGPPVSVDAGLDEARKRVAEWGAKATTAVVSVQTELGACGGAGAWQVRLEGERIAAAWRLSGEGESGCEEKALRGVRLGRAPREAGAVTVEVGGPPERGVRVVAYPRLTAALPEHIAGHWTEIQAEVRACPGAASGGDWGELELLVQVRAGVGLVQVFPESLRGVVSRELAECAADHARGLQWWNAEWGLVGTLTVPVPLQAPR